MNVSGLKGWKLLLATIVVVLLVAFVGYLFDRILFREGVPRVEVVAFSDLLTGIFAGGLFLEFTLHERRDRRMVRQRLETIADMNHHIRNALQVISYVAQNQNSPETKMMRESIQRIEWALREVLPGYVPKEMTPPPTSVPASPAQ